MKAFPTHGQFDAGMELRDYFAAKALPTLIGAAGTVDETVKAAYMWADAMMKAREQKWQHLQQTIEKKRLSHTYL